MTEEFFLNGITHALIIHEKMKPMSMPNKKNEDLFGQFNHIRLHNYKKKKNSFQDNWIVLLHVKSFETKL